MSLESLKNRLASQYPDFTLDLAEEGARQEVALKLVELRLERGLSQAQMAEKLGLRQANLSRLESGQANPTVGILGRIAEALACKLKLSVEEGNSNHKKHANSN